MISRMSTGLLNVPAKQEILDLLAFVESGGFKLTAHLKHHDHERLGPDDGRVLLVDFGFIVNPSATKHLLSSLLKLKRVEIRIGELQSESHRFTRVSAEIKTRRPLYDVADGV